MKQIWTNRLMASKAVEATPEPLTPQSQPSILANNPKVSQSRKGRVMHGFESKITTRVEMCTKWHILFHNMYFLSQLHAKF
jgi:hypothetical protein